MDEKICLFWFRRDLRIYDNPGLYHALKSGLKVIPLFIFDTDILERLRDKDDPRVSFIYLQLQKINRELALFGTQLLIKHGSPVQIFKEIIGAYKPAAVYTNHDYEPEAIVRDETVKSLLLKNRINYYSFKDQVIFEKEEIIKGDGLPYNVFTPYSKKWKEKLDDFYLKPYPSEKLSDHFYKTEPLLLPPIETFGFTFSNKSFPQANLEKIFIKEYQNTRDFPAQEGTSRVGIHLRFGTISIRKLAKFALETNETFLNELIWREFYMMILYHFPHVVNGAFHKKYDKIPWLNNEDLFQKWCSGHTGIPIVDAGMRELNETGYMHNRVRMITASFLTKHLLIDWRWGERYFADKLLDFELASNNGGWQWSAGTGCDAAPYFRIFNPETQALKFDKKGEYIRKWVPEYGTPAYVSPIIDLKVGRDRALTAYKAGLEETMR